MAENPYVLQEVTAGVAAGRLLLFIVNDLNDQRDQRDDEHTESEKLGPCNHTDHPLFIRIGGKEDHPRVAGEPPTVTGSTAHSIAQLFDKSKGRPVTGGSYCIRRFYSRNDAHDVRQPGRRDSRLIWQIPCSSPRWR